MKKLALGARSDEHGTTLIELMIAMGLLMVIAAVALGSITLAENQQSNTYARTVSISQAQLTSEAVTRAIRNADNPYSTTDTPIIEASPYELYFYQGSYSNAGVPQLAVIWLSASAAGSLPSPFEGLTGSIIPSCIVASPCFLMEDIYSTNSQIPVGSTEPPYPAVYRPLGSPEVKTLGSGIVLSSVSTSTSACSSGTFTVGGSISDATSIPTPSAGKPGIFQFYDGCHNAATDLSNLQTIGVTLQAQYQAGKPLVSVTSYVQIRNLSSGS